MDEKLKVSKVVKEFILSLDSILINFPRKELILKNRMMMDCYDVLELIYKANESQDEKSRVEGLSIALSKLYMLDFYFEKSYKMKYINQKTLNKYVNHLSVISKMIRKWIAYEKNRV